MDLGAYMNIESLIGLLPEIPPRLRGIRLMKLESPLNDDSTQFKMYDKYCGEDVIYIHTRCGSNNYEYFEMDKWEERNAVLDAIDDEYDETYRDTYISIPEDKLEMYKQILEEEE